MKTPDFYSGYLFIYLFFNFQEEFSVVRYEIFFIKILSHYLLLPS